MRVVRQRDDAENAPLLGQPAGKKAAVNSRRALGNIANKQGNRGKEGDAQVKPGVLTRRAAAQQLAANPAANPQQELDGEAQPARRAGLRPRAAKAPAPAALAAAPGPAAAKPAARRSMSQALEERSQAAVALPRRQTRASKKAAAAAAPAERPPAPCPPSPLPDIDAAERAHPLHACDVVDDLFAYYHRVEPQLRVSPGYLDLHQDINDRMRAILCDWLVDVHLKFKLLPETLYLTINLIDRFLEKKLVARKHLQLVGITAMHIASKYEEIWSPQMADWVYICDRAYTKEQILGMEKVMLSTLRFSLTVPTPYAFLGRYLKAAGAGQESAVTHYATYLVDLSLVEYGMLRYSYSTIAAAAVYAAQLALSKAPAFPHALEKHSKLTAAAVQECATELAKLHYKAPNNALSAVYKKYSVTARSLAALLPPPASLLGPITFQEGPNGMEWFFTC